VIASSGDGPTRTDVIDETTATSDLDEVPADATHEAETRGEQRAVKRRRLRELRCGRIFAYVLLPALALALTVGAGYLKFQDGSARAAAAAQTQSTAAASDSAIALLSYRPDTVEKQLTAARDRLTGTFRDSYDSLIHNVVIPGAQQKQISAVATVPAAASMSATSNRAVVLLFVDQTITAGADAPTNTASSVKVTLDKIGDQWLISDFTPV
jgi:Mce-associated membrane protein